MKKQPLIQQILHGMQNSVLPSDYWLISDINFPEIKDAQLVIQRDGLSVWEHTMSVIDLLSIKNPITLLSGLFHDLGKSCVTPANNPSLPKFHGHAIASADIAKIKLNEWQASPHLIDRVIRLVLTHMYDISNATRKKTIRKFIASIGLDNVDNWFTLRKADSASYSKYNKYKKHIIDPFYKVINIYLDELLKEDDQLRLLSKSNVSISGKEVKKKDISLLTKGVEID